MPVSRNTLQRQLVLQAVQSMHTHPTAEEVYQQIAQQHPSISKATVYRNLGLLAQRGEIRRVSHLNAADRFDFHLAPHYHFHCKNCDKVFDIDLPYDETLLARVHNPDGFLVEEYETTFSGLCKHCQTDHGQH